MRMKTDLVKVPLFFLLVCITSPSPPLVILLVERIKKPGLCVMMAMTSLCHFCDHLSCKSAAEDCPRPPLPLPPIHWRIRLATVAFPPVQLPDVCLPPLPHATRNQHHTTPL